MLCLSVVHASSFIGAGLKNDGKDMSPASSELSVMNLSVHPAVSADRSLACGRLQLPVHRHGSAAAAAAAVAQHYSVAHGCPSRQSGEV